MLKKAERQHLDDMVEAAAFALQPDLIELKYRLGEDHAGDPCIEFDLVVADAAVKVEKVEGGRDSFDFDRYHHLEEAIRRIVEPHEYGLCAYFSLKLKSELEKKTEAA